MAEEPVIAKRGPIRLEEEPGVKFWCACGRSENQPYCDGSHAGTGLAPVKVEIDEAKSVVWCGCKHSGNKPYCDGAHRDLPA